jgi:hypothetical protein
VVDHQLDEHLEAPLVRRQEEGLKIVEGPILGMHAEVVGDVVAVVLERRGEEREEPDAGDAQVLQVVQLLQQTLEVAHAVVVAVGEGADVQLVDDRVLVPQRIGGATRSLHPRPFRCAITAVISFCQECE